MACNKCIWRDQCNMEDGTVCDYFEGHNLDDLFASRNSKEYFADLRDRNQEYMELLRDPSTNRLLEEG